ncbi:MAG: tRNA dihydrouridine synthase DusB [Holosporales bacterium]|nr:tRNA dihydrouridine synthase DusB [Holosporales bacterium]
MAGITDLPFRRVVRSFGDFMVFSEMVASQAVVRAVRRTGKIMEADDDQHTSIQLVGADPQIMAQATELVCGLGAKHIDINFGCPVKKVIKTDAGSAIMRDEKRAAEIIDAVVKAASVPVSVKMRLGWDEEHMNAKAIAMIAEDLGVAMVTVHGRTRNQMFSGKANWKAVAEVKDAVKIPVIVNGDIVDAETAKRALEESGADGVMIGRGALGSPWILRDIQSAIPTQNAPQLRVKTARTHIDYMFEFYEPSTSIKLSRRIMMYYIKGMQNAGQYRQMATLLKSRDQIDELLELLTLHIS